MRDSKESLGEEGAGVGPRSFETRRRFIGLGRSPESLTEYSGVIEGYDDAIAAVTANNSVAVLSAILRVLHIVSSSCGSILRP